MAPLGRASGLSSSASSACSNSVVGFSLKTSLEQRGCQCVCLVSSLASLTSYIREAFVVISWEKSQICESPCKLQIRSLTGMAFTRLSMQVSIKTSAGIEMYLSYDHLWFEMIAPVPAASFLTHHPGSLARARLIYSRPNPPLNGTPWIQLKVFCLGLYCTPPCTVQRLFVCLWYLTLACTSGIEVLLSECAAQWSYTVHAMSGPWTASDVV